MAPDEQQSDPKWAALVDDRLVPMPRRRLRAQDILHQSGAKPGQSLIRDFNSPNDMAFSPDAEVDLAEGNVFRTEHGSDPSHQVSCDAPAKLAFVVDDHWEVTIQPEQTGASLRGLLDIALDVDLFRDHESPRDEEVGDDKPVRFSDGPVFISRPAQMTIIVNGRQKTVDKRNLSFDDLVTLTYDPVPTGPDVGFVITYSHGPRHNPEGTLREGGVVRIKNSMVFNVTTIDRS